MARKLTPQNRCSILTIIITIRIVIIITIFNIVLISILIVIFLLFL